jgi:cytochrome c2
MADVFISYKRENRPVAEALDRALSAAGFSCWWDTSLVAGEHFNEAIQRELASARCVLVLWTMASHASQWVQAEAVDGFNRKILVAARLDDVALKYPYGIVQTADLRNYRPGVAHAGVAEIVAGVAGKLNAPAPPSPTPRRVGVRSGAWLWGVAAAAAAVAVLGVSTLRQQDAARATTSTPINSSMTYQSWRAALRDPVRGQQLIGRGAEVAKVCRACHSFIADGVEHIGPSLQQAFDGRIAAAPEYTNYSQALRAYAAANVDWTYEALDRYLKHPEDLVEGTSMSFAGVAEPDDRAALIAYMRQVSVNGGIDPQ